MKPLRVPDLALGLMCIAAAVPMLIEGAPLKSYRIEVDAYVRDEKQLCDHAWKVAIERFGPGVAEIMTMTRGQYAPTKCLAVLYQVGSPDEVVSAGINVKEISK